MAKYHVVPWDLKQLFEVLGRNTVISPGITFEIKYKYNMPIIKQKRFGKTKNMLPEEVC